MNDVTTTQTSRRPTGPPTQTAKRNYLAELSSASKPRPTAAVFYGPPGIGKTSFGAAIPGRVFLIDDKEDGINTLKSSRLVQADIPVFPAVSNWADVLGTIDALATGEHAHKCLVVDTIGGLERLCHEHVCRVEFNGEWGDRGFGSYQKGYEVSLAHWREMLNGLDRLRTDKGMSIMLLGHSIVKPYKNPSGADYDRYQPDVHPKTWAITHKWADLVLFGNYFVETTKEGGRAKGKGGQDRIMYTEYTAAYEAKNRHALPNEISMGTSGNAAWANLITALKTAKEQANGTV